MGRPKLHDDALRDRLIGKAAAFVFEDGVDALSLRRLATAAGTSTTAVYSLFGNKAGLLESLYREAARRFGARLALVGVTDDPVGDIVRLGLAYREYARDEPHLYGILFARTEEPDPEAGAEAARTIRPLLDAVRRGQEAGRLVDAPADRIALSCWGIAHGLVSLELAGTVPEGLDIAAGYEDALNAMVAGWSTNRPS
ncbi:TetR/AcrR family transcriptional regulator [Actinophytocola oryzae]|uniref:TetR family transcriptional regulator n=1 Tax=Actinophytocola oryzae TaxID=502181 RepID=A0A4R7UQW1_9PSEU|nr:TetR-like C-terminal domain-containing protein [Actinophytocola oryzae]TDV36630.1 TetR family transcriptional regulator [Actinophytocola oryzae]